MAVNPKSKRNLRPNRSGRKRGAKNKTPKQKQPKYLTTKVLTRKDIADGLFEALSEGEGVTAYFIALKKKSPAEFARLVGRMLPQESTVHVDRREKSLKVVVQLPTDKPTAEMLDQATDALEASLDGNLTHSPDSGACQRGEMASLPPPSIHLQSAPTSEVRSDETVNN